MKFRARIPMIAAALVLGCPAWGLAATPAAEGGTSAGQVAEQARPAMALAEKVPPPAKPAGDLKTSAANAAAAAAAAALNSAKRTPEAPKVNPNSVLALDGKPGEVRLVVMQTDVIQRSRWIVPKVPIPPFIFWNKWLDEHPFVSHTALDWVNEKGEWWHTELRGMYQMEEKYRVGQGEFRATGTTIYGIFVAPGRTDTEGQAVLLDEKITLDWHKVVEIATEYGRKDKRPGDPGTGGRGKRNVGLGGPAWRPSCNSNTYINYILKKLGVEHPMPEGAVGWDRTPTFPYSSDADANER
ncbi:MAG: hypothetical protein HY291_14910 [Planctomycetes bacterium]|nr:hypothetical protein [Planctomycetota bacterium]